MIGKIEELGDCPGTDVKNLITCARAKAIAHLADHHTGVHLHRRPGLHRCRRSDAHLQELYRRFATGPPPIRMPQLLHAQRRLTILGHLDGVMPAADRYPRHLDEANVRRALQALDALHVWTPAERVLGDPQSITSAYVNRHQDHFPSGRVIALDRLYAESTEEVDLAPIQ